MKANSPRLQAASLVLAFSSTSAAGLKAKRWGQKDVLREGPSAPFLLFSPSSRLCLLLLALLSSGTFAAAAPALQASRFTFHVSRLGNPYLFQGARYDAETGLYYFRHRYYDPRAGRFLQRDPVWDEQNVGGWYTFVGNGAVSRRDPFGLDDESDLRKKVREAEQEFQRAKAEFERLGGQNAPEEVKRKKWAAEIERNQAQARLKLRQYEQERQKQGQQTQPPPTQPPPPPPSCPPLHRAYSTPEIESARQELEIAVDWLAIVENDRTSSAQIKEEARQAVKRAQWKIDQARARLKLRQYEQERQKPAQQTRPPPTQPPPPPSQSPAGGAACNQTPPTRCERENAPLSYENRPCPHCEEESLRRALFQRGMMR